MARDFFQVAERQHALATAKGQYERLRKAFDLLGYKRYLLPKGPVEGRAAYVLKTLVAGSIAKRT